MGTTIMTLNLNASMAEVTRLTRAGRLAEAMALLQGSHRPIRMAPLDRQFIDMVPPRSGSGHLMSPSFDTHHGSDAVLTQGLAPPHVPKPMRGFLAHLAKLGSSPGRGGMAGLAPDVQASMPDGARFEERTYANDAGTRTYKLYIPSC